MRAAGLQLNRQEGREGIYYEISYHLHVPLGEGEYRRIPDPEIPDIAKRIELTPAKLQECQRALDEAVAKVNRAVALVHWRKEAGRFEGAEPGNPPQLELTTPLEFPTFEPDA